MGLMLTGCGKPQRGLVVPMKNGVKHGEAVYKNHRTGAIESRSNYVNGKLEGKFYNYLYGKVSAETTYVNGKKEGTAIRFPTRHNKQKRTIEYVNDLKHGFDRTTTIYGKLIKEVPYKEGKEHGIKRGWYHGGEKMYETPMVNGQAHGKQKSFHGRTGKVSEIRHFKKGKLIGIETHYDEYDGSVIYKVDHRGKKRKVILDRRGEGVSKLFDAAVAKAQAKKKAKAKANSKGTSRQRLNCQGDASNPSISQYNRQIAVARGRGEGAALGSQMGGRSGVSNRTSAHNYCVQNANASGLACPYAKEYYSGCMRKFGY